MNPLTLITGLSWQTKAIVLVTTMAIAFVMGWRVHGWEIDSTELRQTKTDIKFSAKLNGQSKQIINKRAADQQKTRIVYRTIHERINNAPDNRVCFTNESLGLWNAAIAGADTDRTKPAGAAGNADAVEPGATARQVLDNAATNFEICNTNSLKHNALIDKVESLEGKMCLCHQ